MGPRLVNRLVCVAEIIDENSAIPEQLGFGCRDGPRPIDDLDQRRIKFLDHSQPVLTRLSGFSCRNLTRLSVRLESDRVPQPTILQGEREERRGPWRGGVRGGARLSHPNED